MCANIKTRFFTRAKQVMYELANQYMRQVKVPKVLINGAISVLRKSVQKKGNFDIRFVQQIGRLDTLKSMLVCIKDLH